MDAEPEGTPVRFDIDRGKSGKEPFFWRVVASNGQTLATSERHTRKQSCQKAIASVQAQVGSAEVVDKTV